MTGVIPSEPIRKTPAGCRGFLLSKLLKLELGVHPEYELKLLQDQLDNKIFVRGMSTRCLDSKSKKWSNL